MGYAKVIESKSWWYIKNINKFFPVPFSHIRVLYDNYKDFGITEEELDNWHKKWNIKSLYDCKEIGNYDEKENEFIHLALKKDNYRIYFMKCKYDWEEKANITIIVNYEFGREKNLLDFLLLNKIFFKNYDLNISNKKKVLYFNNIEAAIEYYDN